MALLSATVTPAAPTSCLCLLPHSPFAFPPLTDFRLRVIEHNLQVIGGYYSRIRLARLAQMLDLSADEVGGLLGCWVGFHFLSGRLAGWLVWLAGRAAWGGMRQLLHEPCPPSLLRTQAEKHLSEMVVSGALSAKVDRPAGVVRFSHRK